MCGRPRGMPDLRLNKTVKGQGNAEDEDQVEREEALQDYCDGAGIGAAGRKAARNDQAHEKIHPQRSRNRDAFEAGRAPRQGLHALRSLT